MTKEERYTLGNRILHYLSTLTEKEVDSYKVRKAWTKRDGWVERTGWRTADDVWLHLDKPCQIEDVRRRLLALSKKFPDQIKRRVVKAVEWGAQKNMAEYKWEEVGR